MHHVVEKCRCFCLEWKQADLHKACLSKIHLSIDFLPPPDAPESCGLKLHVWEILDHYQIQKFLLRFLPFPCKCRFTLLLGTSEYLCKYARNTQRPNKILQNSSLILCFQGMVCEHLQICCFICLNELLVFFITFPVFNVFDNSRHPVIFYIFSYIYTQESL